MWRATSQLIQHYLIQVDGWSAVVVIFLKALSMGPHPELQASFEGRKAVQKVAEYLKSRGISYAEFESLLGLWT